LGLASHVGLRLGLPTVGAAKSRLCGEHREPGRNRGCAVQLCHADEVIGKVVRTRTGVRPIYVSVGHQVTLADAVRWVLRAARGRRLPEPTRQAHLHVTSLKRRQGASPPRTERTRAANGDTDRNSESGSGP
jgi:deoxyribonuclease V